ncbi:MAG: hypothetical protein ABSF91_07925 [Bacteroidota bacterium]|jgi:hypothetical protein
MSFFRSSDPAEKVVTRFMAIEIAICLIMTSLQRLNKLLYSEAIRLGNANLHSRPDEIELNHVFELYFSFMFGRLLARYKANSFEGKECNAPNLPKLPNIVSMKPDIERAIMDSLSYSGFSESAISKPEKQTLGWKAASVSSCFLSQWQPIESAFQTNTSMHLRKIGYPETVAISMSNLMVDHKDLWINEICLDTEKFLADLKERKRRDMMEVLADRLAVEILIPINKAPMYDLLLQSINPQNSCKYR